MGIEDSTAPKDCLECRVVGVATFSGLCTYATYLRLTTPVHDKKQRLFLSFMIFATGSFAAYRAWKS